MQARTSARRRHPPRSKDLIAAVPCAVDREESWGKQITSGVQDQTRVWSESQLRDQGSALVATIGSRAGSGNETSITSQGTDDKPYGRQEGE